MPRMDGIELVSRIKADPRLQSLPVMVVSYKDREEDRRRGWTRARIITWPRAVSTTTRCWMPSRTSSEGRRRENRDRQRFADRGRNPAAGDRAGAWPGSGLGGVQRPGSRRAMRPRPSRRRADGPDHAGHGWRRGHPPHHGRDALRHRGGHGRRGATRRGCSTPWATARWTRPTRRWSAAPTCGAAAPLLRKIRNIGWLIGRYGSRPTLTPVARPSEQPDSRRLLVIGASAGGPATLAQLLRDIPLDFPAGIVLVQHVDASFAAGMADWLNDQVPLPVRLVREGENRPPDRCCWPAPTTICICWPMVPCVTPRSPRKACTGPPLMYFSIAWRSTGAVWRWGVVDGHGTGRGPGLKALRERGCLTIAQDQATSAVYGMPKAAAAMQAAVEIRPLDQIAPRLIKAFA